jgi:hypothetical protein
MIIAIVFITYSGKKDGQAPEISYDERSWEYKFASG